MSGVTVDEVLQLLRERRGRLPHEIGAFLALSVLDQLVEESRAPGLAEIVVREDGTVDVSRAARASEAKALEAVHTLLVRLLSAAGEGVPPMLLDLVEEGAAEAPRTLATLRGRLEAALVPLNRGASERVLARTLRDLRRAATTAVKRVELGDVELDALLEGRDPSSAVSQTVIRSHELDTSPVRAVGKNEGGSIFRGDEPGDDRGSSGEAAGLRRLAVLVLLALAVVGGLAALTRRAPTPAEAPAPRRTPQAAAVPAAPRGRIELTVAPEGAVVRLFVGRAPTLAEGIPVGVAQELVGLADDGTVSHVLVPPDAAYVDREGLPELSVALPATAEPAAAALAVTRLEAATMGASTGRLGRLRVDAARAGDRVYRTVGFAPLARLGGLSTSRSHELLVSAPGHVTQRVVVAPTDFEGPESVARASVTLRAE